MALKNNYWMKLWFDILRDPKMGMLPDRLWRRVIELFLIAGQHGEDGLLPDVATIAWHLNKPVSAIKTDLAKISDVGIVHEYATDKWLVTNFKKRNEAVAPVKRMKDFRMRERYEKGDEPDDEIVTETLRECDAAVTSRNQEEQRNRSTDNLLKDSLKEDENSWDKFAEVFKELTGLPAKSSKPVKAMLQSFKTQGVTLDEYSKAIQEMQEKGYTIATMASPETWVMNNRKPKPKNGNGSRRVKPDLGDYVPDKSSEIVITED